MEPHDLDKLIKANLSEFHDHWEIYTYKQSKNHGYQRIYVATTFKEATEYMLKELKNDSQKFLDQDLNTQTPGWPNPFCYAQNVVDKRRYTLHPFDKTVKNKGLETKEGYNFRTFEEAIDSLNLDEK